MPGQKESVAYYDSPIGTIEIRGNERGVSRLDFVDGRESSRAEAAPCLKDAARELDEYFRGSRRTFAFPLALKGTEFQRGVWRALLRIPFGATASYGEVAAWAGRPGAARAVGQANHRNPVAIVIPCHRVVGRSGNLVGYGGGLWRKKWLLEHERRGIHEK
jgi:methylated-DNA-[protein]-cysteine S-methyltransferase